MAQEVSSGRILARLALALLVFAACFFGSAGTFRWPAAWLFILMYFAVAIPVVLWLRRTNPELLQERLTLLKRPRKGWDRSILRGMILPLLAVLALPGLDAIRFQWSHVPLAVQILGFVGVLAAIAMHVRVMKENSYLSRVVEIQKERGHRVISTGPYAVVRHPMYVASIVLFVSFPLALGSLYSLIPAVLLAALFITRTALEDRTLREELDGYLAYSEKVKSRLLPGVW